MPSPSNDVYQFGPCRLDVRQRVLTSEHHPVALAPKTLDLLLLFVRSPGRAFSKQELMTALWPDTFVEEANLSFQISTLRKALGDGASESIETVPQRGYRFAADVKAPFRRRSCRRRPLPHPSQRREFRRPRAAARPGYLPRRSSSPLSSERDICSSSLPQPAQPREPASAITTPLHGIHRRRKQPQPSRPTRARSPSPGIDPAKITPTST